MSQVQVGGGYALAFNYGSKVTLDAGFECVLTNIAVGSELVTYSYEQNKAGLVSKVVTPSFEEDFVYDAGFRVVRQGATIVNHVGTSVSSSSDPGGAYSFSAMGTGDVYSNGTACSVGPALTRTVSSSAGRTGDGTDTSAGLQEIYTYINGRTILRDTMVPLKQVDSCSTTYACSPGSIHWVYIGVDGPGTTCSNSNPGYNWATKNKRDNWTVTPTVLAPPDGGPRTFEQTARWLGVPNNTGSNGESPNPYPDAGVNGANALETTSYTYAYNAGTQSVATETRPSALTGNGVVTTYVRSSSNRLTAQYQSGSTMLLDGGLAARVIARFWTYDGGVVATESGPCEVATTAVTSCGGDDFAHRIYEYDNYGLTKVSRWARVSPTPPSLDTTYGGYTAVGDPGWVIDENGVRTDFTYSGHNVTSRAVADGGTWHYSWEDEKLTAIRMPQGNSETFCYRAVTTPSGACDSTAAWTGRLQRTSKMGDPDGGTAGWTESIVYDYWSDGSLKSEIRYTNAGGTAEARFKRTYAADAHKRQTLVTTGLASFSQQRAYDAADNVAALGPAFNSAPSYCRESGGALSKLCAQLGYDRAERVRSLDLFETASSSPIRTCIDYDKRGNVSRVTTGCGSGDTCDLGAGGSECGSEPERSNDYVTDDFGNVVEVRLSGTDNGSGGRGVFRFEYDGRGNLIKQQTEAQRSFNPSRYVLHAYDRIQRRTSTHEVWSGSPAVQHLAVRWSYDDDLVIADWSCEAPLRTLGRLRAVSDPLSTRWYQYDLHGRITKEIRETGGCGDRQDLVLSYTANGNLASMRYGYGREVHYLYGDGGLTDREIAVTIGVFAADGGVTQRTLVDEVKWEPYGELRGYRMNFPLDGGSTALFERETGAASSALSAACPTSALSETNDQTGRLRSIRVSSGSSNIYRRSYVWRADQVEQINTCYLGGIGADGGVEVITEVYSPDAGSSFGYDGLGQVRGGKNVSFGTNGGPMQEARFTYDSRGNITNRYVSQYTGYQFQYDGGAATRDRLTRIVATGTYSSIGNRIDLQYDRDGRATKLSGDTDSTGSAPALLLGYDTDNPNLVGPGSDSVMTTSTKATATGSSPTYTYWYDAENRRQAKVYPVNNLSDIFRYDLGHQLLEDRGNLSTSVAAPYPIDEYIWLGGAPVAIYRAKLDSSLHHAADDTGTCSRLGDGVSCGVYFVVVDHIGKPVLALNGARKISGAGEYDPYGNMNRTELWWWTYNPQSKLAEGPYWQNFTQRELGGMEVSFRNHFALLDTEQDCNGVVREGPSIWNYAYDWGSLVVHGGHNRGEVWTPWRTPPSTGSGWRSMTLGWGTLAGNCYPTNCTPACPQASGSGWSYAGFVHREYEYRRFEAGVTPYFPALRFPGQYHDEETDLNENWHRYYYPFGGRYLSPEPMLRDPNWVQGEAMQGFAVPTYAYARNNPIRYTDPTGLAVPCGPTDSTYSCCIKQHPEDPQHCSGDDRPMENIPNPAQAVCQRALTECVNACFRACDPPTGKIGQARAGICASFCHIAYAVCVAKAPL